ncbi:TetR family transcriptional regulator [Micromonospora rifamycinica]|uniref:Transcriptional regulator, TetR family n=1 Tax=Micromonospora rifamycinica TaxID=291594 RepID=A0A109IND8_9ACTN|nr:TetR family transcriptional regulator [Micromonospora rifamycinica]SCG70995.1 transcriptional regulator, TetR family [Micromonospora rifamycinica]
MLARVSSTPSFKRLPRAVREQQMLDAAVKVFSRRGFHAASMDEIAEDAGISKPMVYAYLGTKEELFIACLHREAARMMLTIAGAADPDLPADQRLWRGLRAFFGFVGAHRDGWAVLYRQARGSPPFATELAAMRARLVEVVAGMFDHALRARGREIAATELEVVAYALVGAGESLADWLADHPEAEPERTATRMMNVAWLGAAQLLDGVTWRPPADD